MNDYGLETLPITRIVGDYVVTENGHYHYSRQKPVIVDEDENLSDEYISRLGLS